jgi:hypothetical protein
LGWGKIDMDFKVTDAAYEGFRLVRREPKVIAVWALVTLAFGAIFSAAMAMSGFGRFMSGPQAGTMTPEVLTGFLAGEGVAVVGAIVITSVMGAGVYRAILRPDEAPATRLRIGGDELRLMLLSVIMGLVFAGLTIALMIPMVLVGVAVGVAGLSHGEPGAGAMIGVVLVVMVSYLALLAGLVFFAVRLSLAGVMTFAERRLRVFESWRLTKGRFWKLLGCYLLVILLMIPVYLVMLTIYGGVTFAFMGGDAGRTISELARPDFSSVAAYFTPARTLYLVLASGLGAVLNAVMYAPAAVVYRGLSGAGPESKAEVFS